jgi:PAB-dependent poly(A)-specific ribonuclease subunit 2
LILIRSRNRRSQPFPDPLVRVYDIRTMRSLAPIAFTLGPAFINVLPRRHSSIVITSREGVVNIADVNAPAATEFYQVKDAVQVRFSHIS